MFQIEKNKVLSKLKTKSPLLFMAGGFLFILIGCFDLWSKAESQVNALEHANRVVQKPIVQLQISEDFHDRVQDTNSNSVETNSKVLGILSLPSLAANLPIVAGIDEDALDVGVGHYPGTALPTENDQIVLSGHRDTVFRRLGDLDIGEEVILQLEEGKFSYKITKTKIVDKDDRTIIIPTYPTEELVLITCYPFHMIGNAPKRYIVYATPTY
ncbi:class D sortase [Bacillus salitolerans]|uniref:Class D sortase n=1 Tax=Bacillus salitolerans TaxID=1437434 RepID=A0ABW4LU61_9BACI